MKVRCISQLCSSLSVDYFSPPGIYNPKREVVEDITVGKDYLVYGIEFRGKQIYYYICDDSYDPKLPLQYPLNYAAPFFDVLDDRLSNSWRYKQSQTENYIHASLLPMEWITYQYFYDLLTDGHQEATILWLQIKSTLDQE